MKLIIGNKAYSSWSLRGWLACKQSGLPFTEQVVPLYGEDWEARKAAMPELAPSAGKVPILWDGEAVVWDSLAIMDYLADKVGADRFWPKPRAARAMARAMVAEMHGGFVALRSACPMNVRRRYTGFEPDAKVREDVMRILTLWAEARARFGAGGPFLFGAFSAADIAFAPVVGRFLTYGIGVPGFAQVYMDALWEHPWLRQWQADAAEEPWVIAKWEGDQAGRWVG